jgi:hypothetical protein
MSRINCTRPDEWTGQSVTRREALVRSGTGFGAVALAWLLQRHSADAAGTSRLEPSRSPLAVKPSHFHPTAKRVIFLFMEGGPSHLDLFDPKPLLNKLDGQVVPESFQGTFNVMRGTEADPRIMGSPRQWKQYGQSGLWVSDWLPEMATCVDDLAVIRSCCTDAVNHAGAVVQMNTGREIGGRPSLGSWVIYGLGTENDDLPAYVVIPDDDTKQPFSGSRNWHAGFMPAIYQGTRLYSGDAPIRNLHSPPGVSGTRQREKLALLDQLNRHHAEPRRHQDELEARIRSFELAFRMQAAAPAAVDLGEETEETRRLYGMDEPETAAFGRNCLLARRLVERGVRFVQLYHGVRSGWDSHNNMEREHPRMCRSSDRPVAGLLKDLKRRGLLDETLVIWGGEFGRTPTREVNIGREGKGRNHNPTGFTMCLAGGGVVGGRYIGATDELGLHAIQDRLHVLDLHATILHLLGVDASRLTFLHQGKPEHPNANIGLAYRKITERSVGL